MKRIVLTLFVVMTVMVFSVPVQAEKPLTPESLPGATVVDDDWVKANLGKIKIYDVRKKAEYVDGHIPGAISVPYKEKSRKTVDFDSSKDRFDLGKFPSDKNEPIIVHCNGPRCWKSYKAAVLLLKAGYKKVYWYRNSGFPGWKSKGYPVE
ncbi:MAG TPA: rhodanese-like domain-containing protein [Nitrospirae bacterium]|nr:rhodanese-like domain-containing protein [Nitrospirota bacterium]